MFVAAVGGSARLVGRGVHRGGGRGCGFASAALGSSWASFLCLLLFIYPSSSHRVVGRGGGAVRACVAGGAHPSRRGVIDGRCHRGDGDDDMGNEGGAWFGLSYPYSDVGGR